MPCCKSEGDNPHRLPAGDRPKECSSPSGHVLAVKDNQPNLRRAIHDFFSEHLKDDCDSIACRSFKSHEKGHGGVDDRYDYLTKLPDDFPLKQK